MTSIRRRTATLVAVAFALLIGVGSTVLYVSVRRTLVMQFDRALVARAAALQGLIKFDAGVVEVDPPAASSHASGSDSEYAIGWVFDGAAWRSLGAIHPADTAPWEPDPGSIAPGSVADVSLPGAVAGRAMLIEFHPGAEPFDPDDGPAQSPVPGATSPTVRIAVAQSRGSLDRTVATVALSLLVVGAAMTLGAVALSLWAVGRGLSPLTALARRVAAISPESLGQPIPAEDMPGELVPIVQRLNDSLAHLDDAFARERRFTAAASHELRTPLAELRAMLEVALTQPRTPERWERTARESLAAVERAQRLTAALLALARASRSVDAPAHAKADIAGICREVIARRRAGGVPGAVHIDLNAPDALAVRMDPAAASAIVANLIDNALAHGDVSAASPVRVSLERDNGLARATVANNAPAISADDLPHLFEPFWRKDAARTGDNGFGLGLAVCRALARGAGGDVEAAIVEAPTLRVTLSIPAAP